METGEVDPPVSVSDFLGAPRTLRAARLCGCRNLVPAEHSGQSQDQVLAGRFDDVRFIICKLNACCTSEVIEAHTNTQRSASV